MKTFVKRRVSRVVRALVLCAIRDRRRALELMRDGRNYTFTKKILLSLLRFQIWLELYLLNYLYVVQVNKECNVFEHYRLVAAANTASANIMHNTNFVVAHENIVRQNIVDDIMIDAYRNGNRRKSR